MIRMKLLPSINLFALKSSIMATKNMKKEKETRDQGI